MFAPRNLRTSRTNERTSDRQKRRLYLSHVTHRTLIQEIRKLNSSDSADRVSPNTLTARHMRL